MPNDRRFTEAGLAAVEADMQQKLYLVRRPLIYSIEGFIYGINDPALVEATCKDLAMNAKHYRLNDRYQQFIAKLPKVEGFIRWV